MRLTRRTLRRLMKQGNNQQAAKFGKVEKKEKKENFFIDKLLFPIVVGLFATVVSNYLARQSYYNDIVDKYTARLKEIVVADKINTLKKEENDLGEDLKYISSKKILKKEDFLKLHISRKLLSDEDIISDSIEKEGIGSEQVRMFIVQKIEEIKQQRLQIRGLMNTFTANTLINLSDNDALIPFFSEQISKIILVFPFRPNNIKRRDIIINALRLSQLGLAERRNGEILFPLFLEKTIIGGYSPESDAKINLQGIDLSLVYLNDSSFTKVNLEGAKFIFANLDNVIFTESNLDNVDFSLVNARLNKDPEDPSSEPIPDHKIIGIKLLNSSVRNATFNGAKLHGLLAKSAESNRICYTNAKRSKGVDCNRVDFSGSTFKETDLSDARFVNAIFARVDFSNAILTNANFTNADLTNANFANANLTGANFTNANAEGIKGISLGKTPIEVRDAFKTRGVKLCNTSYKLKDPYQIIKPKLKLFTDCKKADLKEQYLYEVDFDNVDLTKANLTNSIIIRPENMNDTFNDAILCNTVKVTKTTQRKYFKDCRDANLVGKNLSGLNLRDEKINFSNADLTDAIGGNLLSKNLKKDIKLNDVKVILCNTTLPNGVKSFYNCKDADLSFQSGLKGMDLSGVDFTDADLTYTNLSYTNLTKAILTDAKLINSNLTNANLTNTTLINTNLTNTNLQDAIGMKNERITNKNSKNILCNTKLPDGKIEYRDCPKQ